jgi:hypothetical protein
MTNNQRPSLVAARGYARRPGEKILGHGGSAVTDGSERTTPSAAAIARELLPEVVRGPTPTRLRPSAWRMTSSRARGDSGRRAPNPTRLHPCPRLPATRFVFSTGGWATRATRFHLRRRRLAVGALLLPAHTTALHRRGSLRQLERGGGSTQVVAPLQSGRLERPRPCRGVKP